MTTTTKFSAPPAPVEPGLRREYFAFLSDNHLALRLWRVGYRLVHYINARIIYHRPRHYRYLYYLRRALAKLAWREIGMPILSCRLDAALYCFFVNKRIAEYDTILPHSPVRQDADALV